MKPMTHQESAILAGHVGGLRTAVDLIRRVGKRRALKVMTEMIEEGGARLAETRKERLKSTGIEKPTIPPNRTTP